ncbi:MAG: carbohydrate kinase family protein [Erysipelotrichia bacterium]|nr:carbohydrate kinase family protein [Erysipelotrichia bacterium]
MNVIVIGQTSYDITCNLTEKLVEDRKYRFENDFKCPGGPAFNSACLLGKWGIDTYLVSRINDDNFGKAAKREARICKVNLDYLIEDKELATPYSFILISEGKRTIFNVAGKSNKIKYTIGINNSDYILTDAHEKEISLDYFASFPHAVKIMDGGSFNNDRLEVAKKTDYLIVSAQFAQGYTGEIINESNYREIFTKVESINKKEAVITLGEKGLIYRCNGVISIMPAYKVNSIDTTGAGDIFHGSFTYFLMNGYDYYTSLHLAAKTAAISTEKIGGYTSIPDLKAVLQID